MGGSLTRELYSRARVQIGIAARTFLEADMDRRQFLRGWGSLAAGRRWLAAALAGADRNPRALARLRNHHARQGPLAARRDARLAADDAGGRAALPEDDGSTNYHQGGGKRGLMIETQRERAGHARACVWDEGIEPRRC